MFSYSQYSSLESVIIWKEKHLGTAETVQVSDTNSIKCDGNVFGATEMIKPVKKPYLISFKFSECSSIS